MLHAVKKIENKTSFELNKSYGLDLYAEMMNRAEISARQDISGGFFPACVGRL